MKKQLLLRKHEDKRIRRGHLWAFSNEVKEIRGDPAAGDIIDLCDHSGKFLGTGFYNPHSLIAFRLLTTDDRAIDFQFFEKRIRNALSLRKRLYPDTDAFRLVHGEGDFLPGLVVDRYENCLAVQTFSAGMDKRLTLICDVLESLLHPRGIVERNESPLRALEGLDERKGVLRGNPAPVTIREADVQFEIDLLEGQKTGFFLDQRENRILLRRFVHGAHVLDCFCNDGGFALHAAKGGAEDVLAIDVSAGAIQRASRNAEINALKHRCTFRSADAFEFLKEGAGGKNRFDVVVLDPPSFTKSRKNVGTAKRGYREINANAMKLLDEGGILASASCSHHVSGDDFVDILGDSASAAGRRVRILERQGAAPDHPILPSMPETEYLKFAILQVE